MSNENSNKKFVIVALTVAMCVMAIAYAAFSTRLTVTGTTSIASEWSVKISAIQVFDSGGGATSTNAETSTDGLTATFGVSLKSPGDYILYNITITNYGTFDAVLSNMRTSNIYGAGYWAEEAIEDNVFLAEGFGIVVGDIIKAGQSKTIQVRMAYNPRITSDPAVKSFEGTVSFDFVQSGVGSTVPNVTAFPKATIGKGVSLTS